MVKSKTTKKRGKVVRINKKNTVGRIMSNVEKGVSDTDIRYIIAQNVKGRMRYLGYSQQQLAEKLGITQQCLSIYLSSKQPKSFSLRTLVDVCLALNVAVHQITEPGKYPYSGEEDMRSSRGSAA